MSHAVHSGLCPQCGQPLEIPGHLTVFSCLYCGARLMPDQLSQPDHGPSAESAEAADFFRSHAISVVADYPGIEKEVTREKFEDAFARYEKGIQPLFRQLELAVSGHAMTCEDAALALLDQLEIRWAASKNRSNQLDSDKFTVAVFLVPAVRRMGLACGEEFCVSLQQNWVARYPKKPFYLGNYEDLSAGFQKKILGLCFITTAICRWDQKPDDCAELTALRRFRDGYLRACHDGPDLIDRYYNIAPAIVLHLDQCADAAARYAALRRDYLDPCLRDIETGSLAACKDRYVSMVRSLEQEFLS